jgi:alpha-tubulin suppressor-like RCC1 family protein
LAIRDVAAGSAFTLAVLNNDTLVTWGFTREGQASLPSWMKGRAVSQVETGSNYAAILGRDGRVYGWGQNDFGTLGRIPAGCTTKCAAGTGIPAGALSGVRTISASLGHMMAIKTDGSLLIWGRNDFLQRQAPSTALTGLSAVAAGHSHSLAVKGGRVIAWGRNTWGQINVPANLTGVTAVSAGFDHSLALKSDGTVVCWGSNHTGQCTVPRGLTNVVQISAGRYYSLAMDRNGKVYGWGTVDFGQSKVPNGIAPAGAIAAGYNHSVIGFRMGEVLAWGGDAALGALITRTPTATP